MADLKLCPFCGGEAELFQHYPYMRRRVVSSVCCKSCRANSGTWGRKDKAIEAWNTRNPMEAVVAELENIKTGGDCRHKCKHYDWSVGSCDGFCEDYVRETAISIVRGKE